MVRASGTRSSGRGARRGAKATDLEVPEAKPVDEQQLPLDTEARQEEPEAVQADVVVVAVAEAVVSEPVADEPAAEAVAPPAEAEAEPAVAAEAPVAEAGADDAASPVEAEAELAKPVVIVVSAEAGDVTIVEEPAADLEPQPAEPAAEPEVAAAPAAAEEKVAAAPAVAAEKWDGDPPSVQPEPPAAEPAPAAVAPAAKPAAAAASGRSKRSQQAVTVASSRNLPAVSTAPAEPAPEEQKELLRIFIIDSRWNSAASKVLRENIDVLHKLMGSDPLYVLDQDTSVAVLRKHQNLFGRDPIISVHNASALATHGGENREHGFRLHLGLLKTETQVLSMLQMFTNFLARYRDSHNLEAAVRRKLRREGMAGTFEIIMGGKDMDLMQD